MIVDRGVENVAGQAQRWSGAKIRVGWNARDGSAATAFIAQVSIVNGYHRYSCKEVFHEILSGSQRGRADVFSSAGR